MNAGRDEALKAVLADRLQELARARNALELSYRRVVSPDTIDALSRSDEGMIEIEALTARFARVVDLLVQQTLRTIDEIEGQEPALPIDRINRAEKRGWVAAAADVAAARGLRNRIAHEYDAEGWRQIARAAYALVPSLLLSVERTMAAGQRLIGRPSP
jgi:uncharacterized protein YutE (UPF0331/DUF86 family)